jgi:NAD(P)-dependent dehydrogenase (short-subunit alcohol dehydrogenase family)
VSTVDGTAAVIEAAGDVDILVNNAGIFAPMTFFDISDQEWHRFFDVNVLSAVRLARHYTPGMVKRG